MSFKYPLIGPKAFSEYDPMDFYAYVKGLMNGNISKEVAGVSISIGAGNKLTIRISKDSKEVTREELALLAKEYKQEEMELLQLFLKRKIGVIYDDTDSRKQSDADYIKQAKANARAQLTARRKTAGGDKLLKPKRSARLLEESPVLTTEELTK